MRKLVEYAIHTADEDTSHISWVVAKSLAQNESYRKKWEKKRGVEIIWIARVVRYWQDDGEIADEEEEMLYEVK